MFLVDLMRSLSLYILAMFCWPDLSMGISQSSTVPSHQIADDFSSDQPWQLAKSLKFTESDMNEMPFEQMIQMPQLENFTASNCQIQSTIDKNNFIYLSLKHVNLAFNRIELLPDNGLKAFLGIQSLDLSWNLITNVEPRAFYDLARLVELNLAGNQIKKLHAEVFVKCQLLMVVNLNHNLLSMLPENLFRRNSNLQELALRANKLTTLSGYILTWSKKLEKLDLSSNQLNTIDGTAFKASESLKILDMSSCGIKNLPKTLFKSMKSLQDLYLHSNKMESFDFDLIQGNQKLESIHLNGNHISSVMATRTKYNKRHSIRVYLNNNQITSISPLANVNINVLDLSQNPNLKLDASSLTSFLSLATLTLRAVNLDPQILRDGLLTSLPKLENIDISSNAMASIDLSWFPKKIIFLYVNEANLTEVIGYDQVESVLPNLKIFEIEKNNWNCSYYDQLMDKLKPLMKRKISSFGKSLFLKGVDCSLLRTTTTTSTTDRPTTPTTTEMPTTPSTTGMPVTTVAEELSTTTIQDLFETTTLLSFTSEIPSPSTTTSDSFSSSDDNPTSTFSTTIYDDEVSTTEASTEVTEYFYTTESNDMNFYRIVTSKLQNEVVYWMLSFAVVTILVLCALLSYCSRETKKGVYYVPNSSIVDFEMAEEFRV